MTGKPYLAGFWPMTGAHEGHDLSGHGNDIILHDVDYTASCPSCYGVVSFKGAATSYGMIPGDGVLDVQRSFTWMAWVYPESGQGGPLFSWTTHTESLWGTHIWMTGEQQFYLKIGTLPTSSRTSQGLIVNQWNKVAATYNFENGEVGIYLNGKSEWSKTSDRIQPTAGQGTRGDIYMGFV